ncbi:uncharacterized protein LOC124154353 isoform X1 [Ischnura elegans]|uniref:uncharacterized protein LOC124154353 isoform X1 n=1 Tax=Ischnura elegans TaxID=197161 RepID=UPI001ED86CC9|nr:uncharacterized protein LOC124154353 isoform X1 [Ischnura elegans]
MDDFASSIWNALDSTLSSMERLLDMDTKKSGTEDGNETLDCVLKNIIHARDLWSDALKRAENEPETSGVENNEAQKCSPNALDTVARYHLNSIDLFGKLARKIQEDGPTEIADEKLKKGHCKGCPEEYLEQIVRLLMRAKYLITRAYGCVTGVWDTTEMTRESNCTKDSLDVVVDLFVKASDQVDQVIAGKSSNTGNDDEAVSKQSDMCRHNVSKDGVGTVKLFRKYLKQSIFRIVYSLFFRTISCSGHGELSSRLFG